MAFGKEMAMMGGRGKLAPKAPEQKGPKAPKVEKPEPSGEQHGEESTTITHNADGTHTMDGETHPDHLHMLAALGHKVTGGDKHHIAHHDGMAIHTHGIHESGEHAPGGSHNSAEEAKEAMGKFMDEEAQEPAHQHEEEPAMGAYGG